MAIRINISFLSYIYRYDFSLLYFIPSEFNDTKRYRGKYSQVISSVLKNIFPLDEVQ